MSSYLNGTQQIKGPDDVMRMGIDKYNAACRAIVMRYSEVRSHVKSVPQRKHSPIESQPLPCTIRNGVRPLIVLVGGLISIMTTKPCIHGLWSQFG